MAKSLVITGAQVMLYINGLKIGRVTGFAYSIASPKRAIYGLDSSEPFELAPTTTSINGTISILKTSGDGGAEGLGITPANPIIPSERYFSLLLIDRLSSNVVFRADMCSMTSQAWNAQTHALITGSISFTALTWSNEVLSTS